MQGDAEDERDVEHGAPGWPAVQRGLDVLKVELGRAERRDGRRGVRGRDAMGEYMDGEEEERTGVAGRGEHAGERPGRLRRGEEAFEECARGVHEYRPKDEVSLAEYRLVVFARE